MNNNKLGFTSFFEEQYSYWKQIARYKEFLPARVTQEHKHAYRVLNEAGEWLATVSGRYSYGAFFNSDYPAVGDWVLVEKIPGEDKAIIHELFKRKSQFSRKIAGQEIEEQIVAANVDIVLLVMSLNEDFNLRRLERYLVAGWDSGAKPVIVLTKADLSDDVERYVKEVESIAIGVEIFVTSCYTRRGLAEVRELFKEGVTGAILGSSGAGKSSLTNALIGEGKMEVSSIREDDAKGRHTTTHRELIYLPHGGCIIDTPGMRELQLWNQGDHLSTGFQDIMELSMQCRYRDCTHKAEPGCAVVNAIHNGSLEKIRLQSYFKLQKELAFIEKKTKMQSKILEKKKSKRIVSRVNSKYK